MITTPSPRSMCTILHDSWCRVVIFTYNILAELRPELPGRDDTIKNAPAGKIRIYTRLLEFANFRIPLSRFLLCVLEYYQINFSQWSVLGAAKIDASICPISVPWHASTSILKDPLPSENRVNDDLLALLDHHRTVIRQYPETFLCLVGLSRSFDDVHVHHTLLKDNESGGYGLLNFVKSADPFKVKIGERTLAEGEILLNDETMNKTVPPSAKIIQIVEYTIVDELKEHAGKKKRRVVFDDLPMKRLRADAVVAFEAVPTTGGKSLTTLRRLELQSRPQGVGSSFVSPSIEEFVSSSITPTPKPDVLEDSGSN
ncbi:hypothetical protein Tco_1066000 [Tanacetum coccineum]